MSAALAVLAVSSVAVALWTRAHARRRLELVARAVHELRSPLCAARLAVHAAARDCGWPALAPIDHELGRAGAALEDLDAARSGTRVPDRAEDVDAGDLLDEVCRTWAPLAWPIDRGVRVEPSLAPPVIRADRQRLAQALGNLVGNALEHGAGTVVLRAEVDRGRARLVVEDRGAGLPAGLGSLTRRPRGGHGPRGRGLAIADEIARRHGGQLHAERTTGRCRIVLELPLADGSPELDGPRVSPPSWRWGGVAAGEEDILAGLRWSGLVRLRAGRSAIRFDAERSPDGGLARDGRG